MTIKDSLHFTYDGILSRDMGIVNCHTDSGLQTETFLAESEIKEVSIRSISRPYFQGIARKPIVIPLRFSFAEPWNDDKLRSTARWLCQDYYKEMIFSSNPSKIYYTVSNGTADLIHNCLKQGYVDLSFRNIDDYAYSPEYLSPLYDLSTNPSSGTMIEFLNNGDVSCQPELSLLKVGDGDVLIINLSDAGKEFKLVNLKANEDLFIDSEREEIISSLPDTYRLNDLTGDFLSLVRGINNLLIKGNCKFQFRYQFKFY